MTQVANIWVRRGRAWVFGDDLVLDYDVMDFRFAINRIMEPEQLVPYLFETHVPGFHELVHPGDIVVAGLNFGKGHAHVQGFIAMKHLGLGLIARSMPYNTVRAAVSTGLPFLTDCSDVMDYVAHGEEIEVDFASGRLVNLTRNLDRQYRPLDPRLQEIVRAGGLREHLRSRLAGVQERRGMK